MGVVVILAGCGGEGGSTISCRDYWDGTFGVCLPDQWVSLQSETLRQRGVPPDAIAAFQSEVAASGQFPTVTVTRETLTQAMGADAYSKANIRSMTVIPNYQEIDTRSLTIDDENVDLHIFNAQPAADEPPRRFYQASTIAGNVGYTITATVPVSFPEGVEKEILVIFESATFEAPE